MDSNVRMVVRDYPCDEYGLRPKNPSPISFNGLTREFASIRGSAIIIQQSSNARFSNHHPPIISFPSSFEISCSIFDIPHFNVGRRPMSVTRTWAGQETGPQQVGRPAHNVFNNHQTRLVLQSSPAIHLFPFVIRNSLLDIRYSALQRGPASNECDQKVGRSGDRPTTGA